MSVRKVVTMADHFDDHSCSSGNIKLPKKETLITCTRRLTSNKPFDGGNLKTKKTTGPRHKNETFAADKRSENQDGAKDKFGGRNLILQSGTDPATNFEINVPSISSGYGSVMNGTCLPLNQSLDTKICVGKPEGVSNSCDSQTKSSRDLQKSSTCTPITSPKSRIPLGLTRRKSTARRKSFLKKGDGVGFAAKRKFSKKLEAKGSSVGGDTQLKKGVGSVETSSTKTKPSFLGLTKKKDAVNSTFVMKELAKNKCFKKVLTKEPSSSNIKATSGKTLPESTSKSLKEKKATLSSRKQWNETGVKAFEGMIFSSIFAFSDELRESTESIRVKLQTLNNSPEKSKSNTVFGNKTMAFSKEWRENNQDILESRSQEIAGIFRNLRKVESNLKTIDQAIAFLAQTKECATSGKGYKIIQKGIK